MTKGTMQNMTFFFFLPITAGQNFSDVTKIIYKEMRYKEKVSQFLEKDTGSMTKKNSAL